MNATAVIVIHPKWTSWAYWARVQQMIDAIQTYKAKAAQ